MAELQFSPCGRHLYYLLCSFAEDAVGTTCSISVSSFNFTTSAKDFEPLRRSCPAQHITYRFAEPIKSLSPPFILTYWSLPYLYVALPMLSCSPKIVRVAFQHHADITAVTLGPFQTLQSPIYFPSSTPYRNPQIILHKSPAQSNQVTSELSEHLVLALNEERAQGPGECSTESILPPIIMRWSIPETGGWRNWVPELDERSEELNAKQETFDMLRGTFVGSEQRFSIPIRSGLDWRRKAFVSCA
jgi:hypothetical protein